MEWHHCKGHPDVRHVDADGKGCGGALSVTGQGYVQLPQGFGFPESGPDAGEFVVDCKRWPSYSGWCMRCNAEGTFVRIDRPSKLHRIRTGRKVRGVKGRRRGKARSR